MEDLVHRIRQPTLLNCHSKRCKAETSCTGEDNGRRPRVANLNPRAGTHCAKIDRRGALLSTITRPCARVQSLDESQEVVLARLEGPFVGYVLERSA